MRFIEDIQSVFNRDPAARNTFEVITCYSGVQAMLFYRLTHRLWLLKLKWLARFISMLSRWFTGIEIHPESLVKTQPEQYLWNYKRFKSVVDYSS